MKKRQLALITALSVPLAFLPAACSKDKGDGNNSDSKGGASGIETSEGIETSTDSTTNTKTNTSTDTKTNTNTGIGDGNGGVTAGTENTWSSAAASACNGLSSEPESIPAKIEMVVDVSSSMTHTTNNSNQTKWEQTQKAIVAAFVGDGSAARGLPDTVAVGLLFYPNVQRDQKALKQTGPVETCVNTQAAIPIATLGADIEGSHRITLRKALNGIVLDKTGTPTWDALNYGAYTELIEKSAKVDGDPYIVVITDGMPTVSQGCTNPSGSFNDVDAEPIVNLIDKLWQEQGVKTFLIGSPGSENGRNWMSRAAVLGGTSKAGCQVSGPNWCHMDLTTAPDFGAALTAALNSIAGSVASCNYNIATQGVEGGTVNPAQTVVMARYSSGSVEIINRDDTPADCTQGWYIDKNLNQVVFCSETCHKVQSDSNIQLQVLFGCSEDDVKDIQ
jgi:hypothetical protein